MNIIKSKFNFGKGKVGKKIKKNQREKKIGSLKNKISALIFSLVTIILIIFILVVSIVIGSLFIILTLGIQETFYSILIL